jgi:hypothetical protein
MPQHEAMVWEPGAALLVSISPWAIRAAQDAGTWGEVLTRLDALSQRLEGAVRWVPAREDLELAARHLAVFEKLVTARPGAGMQELCDALKAGLAGHERTIPMVGHSQLEYIKQQTANDLWRWAESSPPPSPAQSEQPGKT